MKRFFLVSSIVCFFLLCACQQITRAQSEVQANLWLATNPGGGGAFNSPVISSTGLWAVGSDLGGVYLSENAGQSWRVLGASSGLTATHIASLVAHPSGKLIIGTDTGIFQSNKELTTVQQVYASGYVSAIAVSANPSVLYAAVHPEYDALEPYLLQSKDAGSSWQRVTSDLPDLLRVTALRVHPVDEDALWVLSAEGRFNVGPQAAYFSTDAGKSFVRLDPNAGKVIDIAYAYDESNLNLMYATTVNESQGNVFKSTDTGFSWQNITPQAQNGLTPSGIILTNKTIPQHLRIIDLDQRNGKESYLWESQNAGSSWTRHSLSVLGGWSGSDEVWGLGSSFQGLQQTLAYDSEYLDTVLWVNSQFVYVSQDGGSTWQDSVSNKEGKTWTSRGVDNVVPVALATSDADPKLVYAGYMDMGLWRSDDAGSTWIDLNTIDYSHNWLGNGGNTLTVIADPSRENVVWAQVAGNLENCDSPCEEPLHLLKSTNRGETWQELSQGLPSPLKRLEGLSLTTNSSPEQRSLLLAANGSIYKSQDDGKSWQQSLNCSNEDCIKSYQTNTHAYVLSPSGIWQTKLAEDKWQKLELPQSMTTNWTQGKHWLHDSWTYTGPIDMAFRNNDIWLVVKGQSKGLYYSNDSGTTWQHIIKDDFARSIEIDPLTKELLYGSSSALQAGGYNPDSKGVLISKNGQNNWQALNEGLAYSFATYISISKEGTRWLISPGQGIMKWQP